MDEKIYVILKVLFDFALEVWFSIVWTQIKTSSLVWIQTVWQFDGIVEIFFCGGGGGGGGVYYFLLRRPFKCQTVWTNILSGLILVQTIRKCYQ